ncbi:hypothetical protein Ancab_025299, partial [Ancistrocladus abbreviatus]
SLKSFNRGRRGGGGSHMGLELDEGDEEEFIQSATVPTMAILLRWAAEERGQQGRWGRARNFFKF